MSFAAWTTVDEIAAIDYMATVGEIGERIYKVRSWIETSKNRAWERDVNVGKCRAHAYGVLNKLETK